MQRECDMVPYAVAPKCRCQDAKAVRGSHRFRLPLSHSPARCSGVMWIPSGRYAEKRTAIRNLRRVGNGSCAGTGSPRPWCGAIGIFMNTNPAGIVHNAANPSCIAPIHGISVGAPLRAGLVNELPKGGLAQRRAIRSVAHGVWWNRMSPWLLPGIRAASHPRLADGLCSIRMAGRLSVRQHPQPSFLSPCAFGVADARCPRRSGRLSHFSKRFINSIRISEYGCYNNVVNLPKGG